MNLNRALFRTFPIPLIDAESRSLLILGLYVGLGAVTLSPLLWASVPPLVDYIGVVLAAFLVLGEPITPARWVGIAFVSFGILWSV